MKFTFEEKLKYYLLPQKIYINYKVFKEYKYGEKELAFLKFLVDPTKNSIDVGANKGVYTKVLSGLSKKVFAFEPNPKMYSFLKKSIPQNAISFPYALGNENKTDFLRIPIGKRGFSNQGASLNKEKVYENYVEVKVECKTLDDMGFQNIGFIKIDVEGFEKEVIEGSKNTILKYKPSILVEIEECHTKRPIQEDIKCIENLGYQGFALFRGGLLKSLKFFDNKIHHNQARHLDRKDYTYNFIFLPRFECI